MACVGRRARGRGAKGLTIRLGVYAEDPSACAFACAPPHRQMYAAMVAVKKLGEDSKRGVATVRFFGKFFGTQVGVGVVSGMGG